MIAPTPRAFYPLTGPGMPPPGDDFLLLAQQLGDEDSLLEDVQIERDGKPRKVKRLKTAGALLEELYYKATYSNGSFSLPTTLKGTRSVTLRTFCGHQWGERTPSGPRRATVMVIGKMLGEEEVAVGRHYVGPTSAMFLDVVRELGLPDYARWYMTNLVKTIHPEGKGNTTLKVGWIRNWLPVLHEELRVVQPDYILCLGSDASNALLGNQGASTPGKGKGFGVKEMRGRVIEYTYPLDKQQKHTAQVMTVIHPAAVDKSPELMPQFRQDLGRFGQLTRGIRWDAPEQDLDFRHVATLDGVRDLCHEVLADCEDNLIGIDAEWHGEHPQNKGAYLRSLQLSWRDKTAAFISFRDEDGQPNFTRQELKQVHRYILKMLKGRLLVGQFLEADLEWLVYEGMDLRSQYFNTPTDWMDYRQAVLERREGGFDTGYAAHSINETDDFSLTNQFLQYEGTRYDVELVKWRKEYCRKHNLKEADLEGYGPCPDEIIVPYGCYDALAPRRIFYHQIKLLDCDRFENNCWEPFWGSMRIMPVVLEINCNGVHTDLDRIDKQTDAYMLARDGLEESLRQWARWPELNLNSVFQVRELLFGERLNGHEWIWSEELQELVPRRIRPHGARSLKLTPIITTDKRPMHWMEVIEKGLEVEKTPSTNKLALAILAQESQGVVREVQGQVKRFDCSKIVNKVRDYRFSSQVLKSVLRPPVLITEDEDDDELMIGKPARTDDGHYLYSGGWPASVCADGRVRTHIYATKETRRWASARPAAQNFAKRREPDYKRILGQLYLYPLRSIIMARPNRLLISADITGAELAGMAFMSGDTTMIEHVRRNLLPEWHPDFYDIHSNIAVLAFRLNCSATKGGLKSIGKSHLRIVAKSVVFGIAYGRGAKAIALAAKEEGVNISVEDAQRVIDAVFEMYPRLVPFFAECRERALQVRWICGPFGGMRRFPVATNRGAEGDIERQAQNFPIQGLVAEYMDRGLDHLYHYRDDIPKAELDYDIVLQIHDDVLLETDPQHVPRIIDEVLPRCLSEWVPIYPTRLDGTPTGAGPYHLGIGTEVYDHWGEEMAPDKFESYGLHPRYGGYLEHEDGWLHPEKERKLWTSDKGWLEYWKPEDLDGWKDKIYELAIAA